MEEEEERKERRSRDCEEKRGKMVASQSLLSLCNLVDYNQFPWYRWPPWPRAALPPALCMVRALCTMTWLTLNHVQHPHPLQPRAFTTCSPPILALRNVNSCVTVFWRRGYKQACERPKCFHTMLSFRVGLNSGLCSIFISWRARERDRCEASLGGALAAVRRNSGETRWKWWDEVWSWRVGLKAPQICICSGECETVLPPACARAHPARSISAHLARSIRINCISVRERVRWIESERERGLVLLLG